MTDTPIRSICVLRLSAIGDTCNMMPIIRTLQSELPDASVTWIIGRTEHRLLKDVSGVEFLVFDKKGGRGARRKLKAQLAGRKFDVLLHMHASMRANRLARYVDSPRKVGFDGRRARDFQRFFCSESISGDSSVHVLDGFFQFVEHLGITRRHMIWDVPLDDADREFARATMSDRSLLISPCSSQRWRNFRNWRAENYAQIVDLAHQKYGLDVVLTGGPTQLEAEYGQSISAMAEAPVKNLIGQTSLTQLMALVDRAGVVLSPDSGPAHMATATGTPVIGLYATSNRWRTGPYLSQEWVVDRYPDAVTRALGKPVTQLPWGYRVRSPYAMDLITVDDVAQKLDGVVSQVIGSA
ncbi:MAG: glycosyltransferase family 9 protein [Gammaproteobacteria bacterium]